MHMLHSQSKLSESRDCVRWDPNSTKFALSTICAEGVPSLLSLIFLLQYHLAITKDNRSRMTVPMTDSHLRDKGFTYDTAVARVDDAAVNIALAPKLKHAPEDQAKSLL